MAWLKMTQEHPWYDPSHETGGEYRAGAFDATQHWQVIWPRAVAKAWADPEFKQLLLSDAPRAIKEHFHFELMPDLNFQVKEADSDAQYDPDHPKDPWAALPGIELTMYLPPAPPVELQAVAITAYEDTGRTYPFTCC